MKLLYSVFLTLCLGMCLVNPSPVQASGFGGEGEKGGSDTLKKPTPASETPPPAKKSFSLTPAFDIHIPNPDWKKVARWDTSDLDLYHVDMTKFRDTLSYKIHNPSKDKVFSTPVKGRFTSGFGYRRLFGRRFHKGQDIDLEEGDTIVAAMDGVIRIARYSRGYGNFVVISHEGGLETLYGHMSELNVKEGEIVKSGHTIGLGGSTGQSTGSHLHFEVRVFGVQVDPSCVLKDQISSKDKYELKICSRQFDYLLDLHDVDYHIVEEGQTLDDICVLYEITKDQLCYLNDLKPEDEIKPGLRLMLEE